MKIGFLGGSFDPIHLGHINLAIELKERACLDEIVISPAYVSPHKVSTPPRVSVSDRLNMIRLAIEGIEGVTLWDYETLYQRPSYTIDAIKELKRQRHLQNPQIYTLLAQDLCEIFHTWKDFEKIFALAPPLLGGGEPFSLQMVRHLPEKYHSLVKKNFYRIDNMSITSTRIRERRKKNLYIGHLLPEKVLDYICKNQLYL